MLLQGQVGPVMSGVSLGAGVNAPFRQTNTGDLALSAVHARYYEQTYRGNVYSGGTTIAALSATTITLTATATPILGIANPSTNNVNCVLLYAHLVCVENAFLSSAGPGVFVWAGSGGNLVTTGGTPWNRKTLTATGSLVKYCQLSGATVLTGLANNLVIAGGTPFTSPTALTYGTTVSTVLMPSYGGVWDIGGSIIVPPGGVFGILNTNSTTTWSVAGELVWEEVPV
jgi:hypothetical protein